MNNLQTLAAEGDVSAQFRLAMHYTTPAHRDWRKAIKLLRQAARYHNHPAACVKLGELYEQGLGGFDVNPKKALKYFLLAAQSDNPHALFRLGEFAEFGVNNEPVRNGFLINWKILIPLRM